MNNSENNLKIITIIPARGGSKGIHNKNIIHIAGQPLLAWTIQQSLGTNLISGTYVSTNDPKITNVALQYGAEIIPRPTKISGDEATSESAILHGLDYLKLKKELEPDIVVFLQCTSPLRKSGDISKAIDLFINEKVDSLISGAKLEDFLFWEKTNDKWKSVNYNYKNRGRRQDRNPQFVENGSIYIFKPNLLREKNNRIGGNLAFFEMEFWQTWEIDTYEDISLVEFFIKEKMESHEIFKIPSRQIKLLVYDFDGVMTDNKVYVDQDGKETVQVNRADGLGISELKKTGIEQIIISSEKNRVVTTRANKLGISCLQGIDNKKRALIDYCKENDIDLKHVAYVGNDINDKDVMGVAGVTVCPVDAHESIKTISDHVLKTKGGNGVIRELLDLIIE